MKIGIAGAGKIVPTFLEGATHIKTMELRAICASERSRDRMRKLQEEYGIEKICIGYEAMLEDKELEAVYIAVPNHLHYAFARQALMKGLHVICEKPFCMTAEELEDLTALAGERKRILFEAISNQYLPNYEKVRELLPELGPVRIAEMNFSQYSSRYDAWKGGEVHPVFDPEKGGGALMDINVYNIHFAVGLFGEPEEWHYFPNMQRGVDTSGILILRYPGFLCSLTGTKDCDSRCTLQIQGEKGTIYSESSLNSFGEFRLIRRKGETEDYALNGIRDRLYYEIREFDRLVAEKDMKEADRRLDNSLSVQKILESCRKSSLAETENTIEQ